MRRIRSVEREFCGAGDDGSGCPGAGAVEAVGPLNDQLAAHTGGRDIAVSNDGYVFLVDTKGRIYQWTGFKWDQIDGSDGLRIAANNRKLLLINTQREIYTRNY